MKNAIVKSAVFLLLAGYACSGQNTSKQEDTIVLDQDTAEIETVVVDEKRSGKEALIYLFSQIYTDQSGMAGVKLIDSGDFLGYEYRFKINDEVTNPWRLGYFNETGDQQYFIFRLYECVYYDNEFDHEVTSNFYAVNRITKEIIAERLYPDDGGACEWNEEFPQ
ncbi:MAG: hypothetical protein LBO74_14480 [Candidatus Symbiothrix sp.]|jgi:hypothetical protein|nr:hypothetical protein [Candidatus Symbiothrix sp.]